MKTIGIVGGGQLGRMLVDAAHKLGFKVIVLDPTPNSPAGLVADEQIVGDFKEKAKVLELGKRCDYLTFEIESANAEALEDLVKNGKSVHPSPRILKIIKDKFLQKTFLKEKGIPTAEFALIESEEDCRKQGEIWGYPFMLKARFDAYDGRGNYVIENNNEISKAFNKLSQKSPLYTEKFVPFSKELSVVSARDTFGTIVSFPVVETVHKNNICHIVRSPAPAPKEAKRKAENLGKEVLAALGGEGVFAVEMFLTKDGEVLINEIAPRVHNSCHHSIEAFNTSQFEEQIRAVTGMPVIVPEPMAPYAVMVNILGEREGQAEFQKTNDVPEDANVHIYGKMETKPERKMGHITVLGENLKKTEEKAIKARQNIKI